MRWFSWVPREMHDALIASKDQSIALLQARVDALEARADKPVPVEVVVKMEQAVPPQLMQRRPKPRTDEAPKEEVDYAKVDETDLVAIAKLAAQELGGMASSPWVLKQTVDRIQAHIRQAKGRELRNQLEKGNVGTLRASGIRVPLTEEEAIEQGHMYVPAHIRKEIEEL